jgi:hypothetical protein
VLNPTDKDFPMTAKKTQAPLSSAEFTARFLTIKVGTSKAADNYGYTRVTVSDTLTGRKFTTVGGGYDMTGSVLGEWMEAHMQDRLDALQPGAKTVGDWPRPLYGINYKGTKSGSGYEYTRASVDGACGQDSMQDIALACGIEVEEVWDRSTRNGKRLGFNVRAVQAPQVAA